MSNFERCIEFVLQEEGGIANHPADPGRLTKYGISQRSYPDKNIIDLTLDEAKAIYLRDYWTPIHGDALPDGINLLVLDCAINQGGEIARRTLQTASGVHADGVIGPVTLGAVNRKGKARDIAVKFSALRALRYATTKNLSTFGEGWYARMFRVFGEAQRMGGWLP